MNRSIPPGPRGRVGRAVLGLALLVLPACAGDGDAGAEARPFRARAVQEHRRERTVAAVTFDGGRRATAVLAGDGPGPSGVAAYPDTRFWTETCRRFVELGFAEIAGRTARHYRCTAEVRMDVWLDTDTDLVLRRVRGGVVEAVEQLEYEPPSPSRPVRPPLAAGERPVPVTLPLLGGGSVTVPPGDGRAETVLVFTTWCGAPCFDAIDELTARADGLAAAGDHVLLVATGEEARTVELALAERPTSLPVAVDARGATAAAWGIRRYPATVVFDARGAVG